MSIDANKIAVRRYYDEVLNVGNVGTLDELALLDYDEHDPLPGQGAGRAEFNGCAGRRTDFRSASAPDLKVRHGSQGGGPRSGRPAGGPDEAR